MKMSAREAVIIYIAKITLDFANDAVLSNTRGFFSNEFSAYANRPKIILNLAAEITQLPSH